MSKLSNSLRKIISTVALLCTSAALAQQLDHYNEIKSAIMEGKSIRIRVNYDKCTNSALHKFTGNSYGIYTPNAMAISNDDHIGTYVMYFTMQDGLFPGRPVYEYGNYVLAKDDSLTITWTILNAADYSQLGNTSFTTRCKLGDSAIVYSTQQLKSAKSDNLRNELSN